MNQTHLYVISDAKSLEGNIFKFGRHKGDEKKLRRRYQTAIPNLLILAFIYCKQAKECERIVLRALAGVRVENDKKNQSEWLQIPFDKLLSCINQAIKFFQDFETFQVCKLETRKRKRQTNDATNDETKKKSLEEECIISNLSKAYVKEKLETKTISKEDDQTAAESLDLNDDTEEKQPFRTCTDTKKIEQTGAIDDNPLWEKEYVATIWAAATPRERQIMDIQKLSEFIRVIAYTGEEKYPISVDQAAHWLGYSNTEYLRELISPPHRLRSRNAGKNVYMENVDYVKKWEVTKNGRRRIKLWLTLSCFKDVCQRARGGETVRKFFIIAEKLLRDHTERIIAGRPCSSRYEANS